MISLVSRIIIITHRYEGNNATSSPYKVFTRKLISLRTPNSSLPEKNPLSSNFAYEQPSDAQALNGMLCLLRWFGQPIHLPECARSRRVGNRCSRHWAPAGDGLGLHRPPPVQYRPNGTIWTRALRGTWRALWGSMRRLGRAGGRMLCLSHSCRVQIFCSTGDGAGPPVYVPHNRVRVSKSLPACAETNAGILSMTTCDTTIWLSAKEKKSYQYVRLYIYMFYEYSQWQNCKAFSKSINQFAVLIWHLNVKWYPAVAISIMEVLDQIGLK